MKRFILLSLNIIIFQFSSAQQWEWIKDIGFRNDWTDQKIIPGLNEEVIGLFSKKDSSQVNSTCFTAGAQTINLVKYNKYGDLIWQYKAYSTEYILDFDLAPDGTILTAAVTNYGNNQIQKFDYNTGQLTSSYMITGTNSQIGKIICDKEGNYYLYARITDSLSFNGFVITNYSPGIRSYLIKLNANDSLIWARLFYFKGAALYPVEFHLDQEDNLLVSGSFYNYIKFNDSLLFIGNPSGICTFLLKFDTSLNLLWGKRIGGATHNFLRTDMDNNIYVEGNFCWKLQVDSLFIRELAAGYWCGDIFVLKIDTNGTLIWSTHIGSAVDEDKLYGFDVSPNGKAYLTGYLNRTVYINNDSMPKPSFVSWNTDAIFFAALDQDGNLSWYDYAKTDGASPTALCATENESVFFTGWVGKNFILNNDTIKTCTSYGSEKFYFLKLQSDSAFFYENDSELNFFPSPNPANSSLLIKRENAFPSQLILNNLYGNKIFSTIVFGSGKTLTSK